MKKLLLFLTPLLLLLGACNKKPSFDTSLLIGKWYTSEVEYEDGVQIITTVGVVFANEKDVEIEAKYNIGGDYFGQIIMRGDYKVSGDIIKINAPESQLEFSLNKDFFDTPLEYEMASKELKKEFMEETEAWGESRVVSITSKKLILEEDGDMFEFEKFQ